MSATPKASQQVDLTEPTSDAPATPPGRRRGPEAGAHVGRSGTWRGRFRRARRRFFQPVMGTLGVLFLRLLGKTWRIETSGVNPFEGKGGRPACLVALWHGRLLIGMYSHRDEGHQVLVSPSSDGELAHALLRGMGYGTIRGSTSRGATRAMREMLRELKNAESVVVTPDGPRGPRHGMNQGLAWMARATGFPIQTVGFGANRAWRLNSWDRFLIPKPFARVHMAYGDSIRVPREGGDAALESATEEVRERLMQLEQRAFAALGCDPDH